MSPESALPDNSTSPASSPQRQLDAERMHAYKMFASAFSYPDDSFLVHFPDCVEEKDSLAIEYDKVFRTGSVWLYCCEYMADNEFQRARMLADIMGFYMAFGLEPDKDRPDAITCEMEFMHWLIFKRDRLSDEDAGADPGEKADVCRDAEKKFFTEHLYPSARQIAEKIIAKSTHPFYADKARELIAFLERERGHFGLAKEQDCGRECMNRGSG